MDKATKELLILDILESLYDSNFLLNENVCMCDLVGKYRDILVRNIDNFIQEYTYLNLVLVGESVDGSVEYRIRQILMNDGYTYLVENLESLKELVPTFLIPASVLTLTGYIYYRLATKTKRDCVKVCNIRYDKFDDRYSICVHRCMIRFMMLQRQALLKSKASLKKSNFRFKEKRIQMIEKQLQRVDKTLKRLKSELDYLLKNRTINQRVYQL